MQFVSNNGLFKHEVVWKKVDTKLRAVSLLFIGVHVKNSTSRSYADVFKDRLFNLTNEYHCKIMEEGRKIEI